MPVRRTPSVPVASRARNALDRRAARLTGSVEAAPAERVVRRVRPSPTRQEPEQELGLILRAPNTEAVYGDAIRSMRVAPQAMRSGEYLHVSDLISKCVRARSLLELHQITLPVKNLSLSDRMTFAMGDAIHDVAKALARDGSPDLAWGKWSCKCGYLHHDDPCVFSEVEEEVCPHCNTRVDVYQEVSIFDEEYGIVGNPDLVFWLPRKGAFHINEIKSISDTQWKELRRPKPEHILQVVFYWLLCHRKGMPLTDRVSIIYFTKGWMFGTQDNYKEFLVDPQAELHRLEDMVADAKAYKAARVSGDLALLPTRTCATAEAKDAKACTACDLCFSV